MPTRPSQTTFSRWICLLALICAPALLYGAVGALRSNQNNILDWLPASFEETQRLFWFVERFGSDEILVLSWPGCTLADERLDRLADALVQPVPIPGGEAEVLYHTVFTGRKTIEELTSPPLELTSQQARQRMKGWLLGPDGTTCAVALITHAGEIHRQTALQYAAAAARKSGVDPRQLRMGGPTADAAAIDRASQQGVISLGVLSAGIGLAATWFCLRKLRLVTLLFVTATFAWAASLSVVYFSGSHLDAVLLMMPALVFVLSISGGIHLTNYYSDALVEGYRERSPGEAIRRGWSPCMLASVTTCIGVGSLAISHVTPVRKFGVFSAVGILLSLLALLMLWPAMANCWRSAARPVADRPTGRRWWRPLWRLAHGYWAAVLAAVVGILPVFGYGLSQLRTSAQLQDLLPARSDLLRDYDWLQQHLGPLAPVEIVAGFPGSSTGDADEMLYRAETVERLRQVVSGMPEIGATIATTTFAPPLPSGGGLRQLVQRRTAARQLVQHRDQLRQLGFLYEDQPQGEELWRISARAPSTEVDYGPLLARIHDRLEAALTAQRRQHGESISLKICGGVPLVYMAQQQLLRDLIDSFLAAFVLIALAMVVLMRSVAAGLVAMIPNVFPALVAFGALGCRDVAIDIGTMMTASAAMGIAVDDTLHFLAWFQRGLQRGDSRRGALQFAFEHCATAMLQTSLICGLGLLAFSLSPFAPISRFAQTMASLLGLALLGDLVLLPALLASPLGVWFERVARPAGPHLDEVDRVKLSSQTNLLDPASS